MMQKLIKTLSLLMLTAACSPSGGSSEVVAQADTVTIKAETGEIVTKDTTVKAEKKVMNSSTEPTEIEEKAEEDCIFDQKSQTDEFIKGIPEFADYSWNDTTKTATIHLPNGEILIAKRGGCNHFGISGQWIQKGRNHKMDDIGYWLEQGKWISKRIMPAEDYETYVRMWERKAYEVTLNENSLFILFQDPQYAEWSLYVEYGPENTNPTTRVETAYYIN